jgi:hypothetical protein
VLNGISEGGPNLVMRFKGKAKIRTETAWDGGLEVGIRSNSICAPLQERPKMLQSGTRRDGENLIAMELPGEANDSGRINSVRQGRKCRCLERSLAAGRNGKLCSIRLDAGKPSGKERLESVDSQEEGFVRSAD